MIRYLKMIVSVVFLFVAGCSDGANKAGCQFQYGNYVAISQNGDTAVDACRDGQTGVLVRYKGREIWLMEEGIWLMSPAFSHDGKRIVFVGLNPKLQKSEIRLLDLDTNDQSTILALPGAIIHAAFDKAGTSLVYWQGRYRESGKTPATEFVLYRATLKGTGISKIDGPYPIVGRPSFDQDNVLYFSYEDLINGKLNFGAKRCEMDKSGCRAIQLDSIGGELANTPQGYYYIVLYDKQANYQYCIRGAGLPDKTICPGNKFSISPDGRKLAFIDSSRETIHVLDIR